MLGASGEIFESLSLYISKLNPVSRQKKGGIYLKEDGEKILILIQSFDPFFPLTFWNVSPERRKSG